MRKALKIITGVLCVAILLLQEYFFGNKTFPILFFIIHLIVSMVIYAMMEYVIDLKFFNKKQK